MSNVKDVNKVNRMTSFKYILNLLLLLKEEPKDYKTLFESGCFYKWQNLKETVSFCIDAKFITIEQVGWKQITVEQVMSHSLHKRHWSNKPLLLFYITSTGEAFLSFYRHKQLIKVRRTYRQ